LDEVIHKTQPGHALQLCLGFVFVPLSVAVVSFCCCCFAERVLVVSRLSPFNRPCLVFQNIQNTGLLEKKKKKKKKPGYLIYLR